MFVNFQISIFNSKPKPIHEFNWIRQRHLVINEKPEIESECKLS